MTEHWNAFFSYARADDRQDRGLLSKLRTELGNEVGVRHGEFTIFQDREGIRWGQDWRERLADVLRNTTFLIPILTPSFFRSPVCRWEVEEFLRIEAERGRADLVLPVYYIGTPLLDDAGQRGQDDLAERLNARNRVDMLTVRTAPRTLRKEVQRLADKIVARLNGDDPGAGPASSGPASPGGAATVTVVNRPPERVTSEFQDRKDILQELLVRLSEPVRTVHVLEGAPGLGKTALVAEVFGRLESTSPVRFHALSYRAVGGHRQVNAAALIADLAEAHPDGGVRARLRRRQESGGLSWLDKLDEVLTSLDRRQVLVVLDDVDRLLDPEGGFRDAVLGDLVERMADRDDHGVRLLLVGSARPRIRVRGYRPADALVLGEGLPPDALGTFVRTLDPSGDSPLSHLSPAESAVLDASTGGHPRSVELLLSVLRTEPSTAVGEILGQLSAVPASTRSTFLLDRVLHAPPAADRQLLEAIAAFGRPIPVPAVERLLGRGAAADVARLSARRLVRRDGENCYLPPAEAAHVLAQLERGDTVDLDRTPVPHTQVALLRRAADYFAEVAAATVVRRVEDLSPHFGEIDRRILGGEHDRAFALIEDLDERHLRGAGHSDALSHFREQLDGRLHRPHDEVRNLLELANAKSQQDRHDQALSALRRARARNAAVQPERLRRRNELSLQLAIAAVYFDDGRVSQARAEYEEALVLGVGGLLSPLRAAQAHAGAALCRLETGDIDGGLRRLEVARALVEDDPRAPASSLRTELLLNEAVGLVCEGRTRPALDRLDLARSRARDGGDRRLAARCLDARAMALVDQDLPAARAVALHAAEEAAELEVPDVARGAYSTLALVHLRLGEDAEALAAADAATRLGRRSGRHWGPFALRGIARLRAGDVAAAEADFALALEAATRILQKEPDDYQVLEYVGLTYTGLFLCRDDRSLLVDAESAYRRARARTAAPGAVRLCLQRLEVLLSESDDDAVETVRAAAADWPPAVR